MGGRKGKGKREEREKKGGRKEAEAASSEKLTRERKEEKRLVLVERGRFGVGGAFLLKEPLHLCTD